MLNVLFLIIIIIKTIGKFLNFKLWFTNPKEDKYFGDPLPKCIIKIVSDFTTPTFLISMGYDTETDDIFIATYGQISPTSGGLPQLLGKIYKLKSLPI